MVRKFFSGVNGFGTYHQIGQRSVPQPGDRPSHSSPGGRFFLKTSFALAATFLIFGLLGSGSLQAAQDERKALTERATAFWEARVKGDWATVFDYLSESERKGGTKEQYVTFSKEKGPFHYLSFKLGDVEVEGDVGWVKTAFEVEPMKFPGLPPNKLDTWQVWEKRDGKWYPIPNERQQEVPKLPPRPDLRNLKEESAVIGRANEFWQAREKEDYKSVYQYLPPAFREKVPADEFLSKKALNTYVRHSIHWAEVSGDHAKVRITVDFRPNDPNLTKMDPSRETIMQEWIKVNNQWYLDIRES
jgi:hypothetical protein